MHSRASRLSHIEADNTGMLGPPFIHAAALLAVLCAALIAGALCVNAGSVHDQKRSHVVITSLAERARVAPLLVLARELQASGLRVTLLLPEEANSVAGINSTGAEKLLLAGSCAGVELSRNATPVSSLERTIQAISQAVGTWRYSEEIDHFVQQSQPIFDPLSSLLKDEQPDLVIIDSHTFAAFDAAQRHGIRYLVHHAGILDAPPFAQVLLARILSTHHFFLPLVSYIRQ